MVVAVDVGNSVISIGAYAGTELLFVSRIGTRNATVDEYAVKLRQVFDLHGHSPEEVEGAIVSSVVPPLSPRLCEALRLLCGVRVYTVGPGLKTGLNIKIDNPSQLGSDLVCVSVAATAKYPAPAVVIDMSTATTFSAIDSHKNQVGCTIVPGMEFSLNALAEGTAQLQKIDLGEPVRSVIGHNTIESMRAGSVYGTAAMLDGMIARFREELGESLTVIATGAQVEHILPVCREQIIYDENLLLDGLRLIYEKNQK
ncbi:MAG: type III pantothenate kinase [Oscillospiraceae bacterium]